MSGGKYDLFKGSSPENALWIETIEGLPQAKDKMNRVASATSSDCFLFHAGDIVASVKNPNASQAEIPTLLKIVIVSSDSHQVAALATILKKLEVEPVCADTVRQYREVMSAQPVGLVFCDSNLSDGNYQDVINFARAAGSKARIVVTSGHAGWPEFLEAMRVGAFDVIATPCRAKDVEWMVIQAKRDERKLANQLLSPDKDLDKKPGRASAWARRAPNVISRIRDIGS